MSAIHLRTAIWPPRVRPGARSGKPWWTHVAAYFRAHAAGPERSRAGDVASRRHILIAQGLDGRWRLGGEGHATGPDFALLSQAVVFARDAFGAAPATIELRIGDVVAVVHQAAGWPNSICGEAIKQRARRQN